MSESKHTAGPWRVEQDTTLIWGDCNPDDATSYGMGYPIAECRVTPSGSWAKGPKGHSEAEANALLIAAAPDLLHALHECQSVLAMLVAPDAIKQTTVIGTYAAAVAADAVARAALAKAEGRS